MANFPAGTFIFSDGTIPNGWTNHSPNMANRYVLGASNIDQVGVMGGSTTHVHASAQLSSVAGHNHGGTKSVTSSTTGGVSVSSGTPGSVCVQHSHNVTITIANNLSHTHTVGETGAADNDPSHTVLMLLRKS